MKKNIKIIIGICLVIVLVGVSFAWFNYYQEGNNQQLVAGDIYLTLTEHGDSILLENALPETAEEARARNDNYIDFAIVGKNLSSKDIYYQIELLNGTSNENKHRLDSEDLAFDLYSLNDQNEATLLLDAVSYEDLNNHKIWVDYVEKGTTSEITKKYRLRMWLAQKIVYGEGEGVKYTVDEFANGFASVKIAVNGNLEEKSFPLKYSYDDANKKFLMTVWNDYFTRDEGIAADDNVVVRISDPDNMALFTYEDNNGNVLYNAQHSLQLPYTFDINKIINGVLKVSDIGKYGSDIKFEVLKNNVVVQTFLRTVYDETSIDKGNIISTITYSMPDGTSQTQYLYSNITNYLNILVSDDGFQGWSTILDGEVEYRFGDIINFNSNITLYPVIVETASKFLEERSETQASCISTAPNKSSFYGEIDADVIYYTGNDESCLKNYVWYSGKLWRIVAVYPNGMMKLVTENPMTSIYYGSTITFDGSWMDQWLSEEFLPTLYNNTNIVVQNAEWNVTTDDSSTPSDPYLLADTVTINKTVGLLNSFEYTKSGTSSGYLHIGQEWWLMTPYRSYGLCSVYFTGDLAMSSPGPDAIGVRPSIVIKSNAFFDNENYDGTRLSPFHIVGDIEEGKTNELLNTRISGEYVKFNNELYRIVGMENNTTKIVNTGYINNPENRANPSDTTLGYFGTDAYINTQSTDMVFWDKYLTDENGWLSTISSNDKDLLVNGTYYLGLYPIRTNYKVTICKNTASELETTTINNCSKYENSDTNKTYTGLVGLLRAGEMMSTHQSTLAHVNDSTNYKEMWLITPYDPPSVNTVHNYAVLNYDLPYSIANAVRPTLHLKSDVIITGGSGHVDDPYEIALGSGTNVTPTPTPANEGTIASCPGCKFMYLANTRMFTTWNMAGWDDNIQEEVAETPTQITSGLYDSYEELIATTGKNYFLGVKLNANDEVTNAYACGVKDGTPFCIEGYSDNSKYNANKTLLNGANLYNNTCIENLNSVTGNGYDYLNCGPWDNSGSVSTRAYSGGNAIAGVDIDGNNYNCFVDPNGVFGCLESEAVTGIPYNIIVQLNLTYNGQSINASNYNIQAELFDDPMGTNQIYGPYFAFEFNGGTSSIDSAEGFFPEESSGLNYYLCFMKNNTVINQFNFVSGGSVIYQGTDEYGNNFEITINNSHSTGNTYSTLSESETFVATLNFLNYPTGFQFSYSS